MIKKIIIDNGKTFWRWMEGMIIDNYRQRKKYERKRLLIKEINFDEWKKYKDDYWYRRKIMERMIIAKGKKLWWMEGIVIDKGNIF